ncbi:MAG: dienelactone hydrolase family protein [Hyphomonadaceae bacterium]|nr:dienelactone hydrolase family protein [Hyphomonadaceae bacterium]
MPDAQSLADRIAALAPHMTVVRPPRAGRSPVVVQFHGCGGRKPLQDVWAARFHAMGVGAVIVDSYTPRDITTLEAYATICTGLRFWGRERAGDVFAAVALARTLSFADPDRIIAAGWSHGGWSVLDAMALAPGAEAQRATGLSDLPAEPLQGLAGAVLLYPYCGIAALARRGLRYRAPTLAILGGRDSVIGVDGPQRVMADLRARGAAIETHVFAAATHAFDEEDARDPRMRYDPELAARAEALIAAFIGRVAA